MDDITCLFITIAIIVVSAIYGGVVGNAVYDLFFRE